MQGCRIAVMAILALVLTGAAVHAQMKPCQDDKLDRDKRILACSRVVDSARETKEARSEALSIRGAVHDDAGRHDTAIADFSAALKLIPEDPATLILRGNAYDSKGEKQLAIADYSEAIRLNPGDAAGHYNRGAVYQELGDKEKALADYKKALEIDPDFDAAKEGVGELVKK